MKKITQPPLSLVLTHWGVIFLLALTSCSDTGVRARFLRGVGGSGSNIWLPNENGTVGIKNFRSITNTLTLVTGASVNANADITTAITNYQSRLSLSGEADTFSGSMLRSSFALSGAFCRTVVRATTAPVLEKKNFYFAGINFNSGPQAITPAQKNEIIFKLTSAFWGERANEEERSELFDLLSFVPPPSTPALNNTTQTENTLIALCTAVASSLRTIHL